MAVSKKISELPVLSTAAQSDLVAIVDVSDGVTKGITTGNLTGVVSVKRFGAVGNGTALDTVACQTALDLGGKILFPSNNTFLCGQLKVSDNTIVCIEGTVKLNASTDLPLFTNKDPSGGNTNITFTGNGIIDGNKANQTAESEGDGIKLLKVDQLLIERLWLKNTEGHSIHINNLGLATTVNIKMTDLLITSPGNVEGSTFGSGVAFTNGDKVQLSDITVLDGAKAGFRLDGTDFTLTNCIADNCKAGGIAPVSTSTSVLTIVGGSYSNNGSATAELGDGIRLTAIDQVTLTGVNIHDNWGSGVMILNGCNDVNISGGQIFNNGRNQETITALDGRSGINVKDNATANTDISIQGVRFFDDQGTPTQLEGVFLENQADRVQIAGCNFNNIGQAIKCTTSGTVIHIAPDNIGVSYNVKDAKVSTATSSTTETTMHSVTIAAEEMPQKSPGFRFEYIFTLSGTAGAKTIRVKLGATTQTFTVAASTTVGFRLTGEVHGTSSSAQRISSWLSANDIAGDFRFDTAAQDLTASWTWAVTAQCANGADSVTVKSTSLMAYGL